MKNTIILLVLFFSISTFYKVSSQPLVGNQAPLLTGLKIVNKQLPDLENKFVFIDFWGTWCIPCRKSLPHLDKLAEKYKDKIVFLNVSDEKEKDVSQFLQKNNYQHLIFGLDIEKNLFLNFDIKWVPQYYLISPKNIILATGSSSDLTDNILDSIITNYKSLKTDIVSGIKITQDSTNKISSVEINERPDSRPFLTQSGYTLIVRDSLKSVLPFLNGVKLANRIRFQHVPTKMIEVKIFSRYAPFDSLKLNAYHQIMASYGITKKEITEPSTVYNYKVENPKLLKDKNTFVNPGVLLKREMENDSTMRFDNYAVGDVVNYLEGAYFPRILYTQSVSKEVFDWDLEIVNPVTHLFVSFERLNEILSKEYGLKMTEATKNETFTIYN